MGNEKILIDALTYIRDGINKGQELCDYFIPERTKEPDIDIMKMVAETCNEALEKYYATTQERDKLKSLQSGWISVEDKLPEERKLVLCYNKYGRMISKDWEEFTDQNAKWFREAFTHWQPLPTPPQKTNYFKNV